MNDLVFSRKISDGQRKLFYKNGIILGYLLVGDDGYWAWWPEKERGGYFTAECLKSISNHLFDLNKDWDLKFKNITEVKE